ncbi:hypothetical protein niasHT_036919 [Heterodera trifolii]|uniref:BTB domain-containing protein n=1 Tax=Heterodera trifolii TaxID=157864 RepID=A0ABD2IFJ1_9BILA
MPSLGNSMERMKHFLSTGEHSDVHFLVGDGDAKEANLASTSTHFEERTLPMFLRQCSILTPRKNEWRMPRDHGSRISVIGNSITASPALDNCPVAMDVPDVEAAAFKVMLSFIYTEDVGELNGDNAMAVFFAAKKYNIPGLVDRSLQIPISELRNVFLAFAQAHLFELEEILCVLLVRDRLLLSDEFEIWNAAIRCADEKCRQNGIECYDKNRREMLGSALFKIRFPNIQEEDFAKCIVPSNVLTGKELLGVYQFNSHPDLYLRGMPGLYSLDFPSHGRISDWNIVKGNRRGTLALEIEKVLEFEGESVGSSRFSEAVEINGLTWQIEAEIKEKRDGTDENKCLGFYLRCDAKEEFRYEKKLQIFQALSDYVEQTFCRLFVLIKLNTRRIRAMQLSVVKGLHGVQRCVINAGKKRGDNFELFVEGTNFKEPDRNQWVANKHNRKKWPNIMQDEEKIKRSRTTNKTNIAGTVSHEAGHAKVTWRNSPRKFLKIKILSSKEGWTMHSGPDPETYTRTEMKRLMVLAVAGKVAEVKAVGHSTGWKEDEKDRCRIAKKLAVTSARWSLIEGAREKRAFVRREVRRLERWAMRTAEEELNAECVAEIPDDTPKSLAGTAAHEAGHAKITWRNSPRKFLKMKILSAKAGWTLHSGPSPQVYTRGQMKRLMVLAVAGKVAELKAVGPSSGWEEDQKDWRRVATKVTEKGIENDRFNDYFWIKNANLGFNFCLNSGSGIFGASLWEQNNPQHALYSYEGTDGEEDEEEDDEEEDDDDDDDGGGDAAPDGEEGEEAVEENGDEEEGEEDVKTNRLNLCLKKHFDFFV